MIFKNCIDSYNGMSVKAQPVIIAIILIIVMIGSKMIGKKKVSPITLIVISGFLGVIVYGI